MTHALPYLLPTYLPGPIEAGEDPPRIDGTLEPAPTAGEVEDLILSEYLESPLLLSLVRAYVEAVAARDATIVAMYEDLHDIERAEGVWLDRLGALVGEPRLDRDDAEYRRGVRVRVRVNRSNGTGPELVEIARLFIGADDPDSEIRLRTYAPRAVVIYVDATPTGSLEIPHGYHTEARAGGVSLQTVQVVRPWARDQAFRLARVADAGGRSALGLADVPRNIGGALTHVLP